MNRLSAIFFLAALIALPAEVFAGRSVTLYLDGARIEQREAAVKGYLEVKLPPSADQGSLRIAPSKGTEIIRVVTSPLKPSSAIEKELSRLSEREGVLKDRLQALSVREEIFKSAAKSQSGKAPKRTKTNPEPLTSIRQGTDYAIAQLESVYLAKRKTEKELEQINNRRLNLSKDSQSGGAVAKVWITPNSGSVTASWVHADRSWLPVYQLRTEEKGSATLSLYAGGVTSSKGESINLVLSSVHSGGSHQGTAYSDTMTALFKEVIGVTAISAAERDPFIISIVNNSARNLPPGEISCFRSGVYSGKGAFSGVDAGKTVEINCGGR